MAEIKIENRQATLTLNLAEVRAVHKALKELKSTDPNVLHVMRNFRTIEEMMR